MSSDSCIVCLGDLSSAGGEVTAPGPLVTSPAKSPTKIAAGAAVTTIVPPDSVKSTISSNQRSPELIALLRPCGHYLHNECLTPWVERANSCPICRASFHLVELMHRIGGRSKNHDHLTTSDRDTGDVISSYQVEDRTQVADLDPSMFLEFPEEEDEDQPCQACGEDDNEDVLMYCDGCQKLWHTYCVDLQEVPYGHWFCDNCRAQRELDPRQLALASRSNRRRTRGQQRRQRGNESSWNQVWQSVWSRINIDLDFPYEDDESSARYLRRHRQRNQANRHAHDAWNRRMQVAELLGAGNHFRETEPALPTSAGSHLTPQSRHTRGSPCPQVESADELMAWRAFEQARASSNEPTTSRKRKIKSATSSPAEADREPLSASKRRRRSGSIRTVSESNASSTTINRRRQPPRTASPIPRRQPVVDPMAPSFLQSLLQEVEDLGAGPQGINVHRPSPRPAPNPPADQSSPRPSSPALSPLPSNHSSPRAMSATPPPPLSALRPGSPTGLSSSIQPVFPDFSFHQSTSPESKPSETSISRSIALRAPPPPPLTTSSSPTLAQPRPRNRVSRILENGQVPQNLSRSTEASPARREGSSISHPRSSEASPTRAVLSLTAKEDVKKLVASALKPHYHGQSITKDEYTTINRDISRKLYDEIGDNEALDVDRSRWEKVAGDEVKKAINALKAQG